MTSPARPALTLPGLHMLAQRHRRVHMVGIAGSGMAALAEILDAGGIAVTGSDPKPGPTASHLRALGVRVHATHRATHVPAGALVVHTAAVTARHPEVAAATRRGQPVMSRGTLLAELMRGSCGLAVAGAHGKSTTAGMSALILRAAGFAPWAAIGARLPGLAGNAMAGGSPMFVAEVDESDGTLGLVAPWVLAVTNVDREHVDRFGGSYRKLQEAFRQAARRLPEAGVVVTSDDRTARTVTRHSRARRVVAGLARDAELRADGLELHRGCARMTVRLRGKRLGRLALRVPGLMNAGNALLAAAACLALGATWNAVRAGLDAFTGMGRRFEVTRTAGGVTVVDDYAHHPREIRATMDAARAMFPGRRILVLVEPHRPSRVAPLLGGFVRELAAADAVVVAPVYGAFERGAVDAAALHAALGHGLSRRGTRAYSADSTDAAVSRATALARRADVLLVMGAGHAAVMAQELVASLGGRA